MNKILFFIALLFCLLAYTDVVAIPPAPPLPSTDGASDGDALLLDANLDKEWATPAGGGTVGTSGSPIANDIAQFSDADTIGGRSHEEHANDLEAELEAVLDLPDLQGQLLGSQVDVVSTSDTLDEFIGFVTMDCVMDAITPSDEGGLNIQYDAGKVWVDDVIQDTDARGTDLALTDDSTNYLYATKAGGATLQVATSAPGGVHALVATINTYGGDIEYMNIAPLCDSQVEAIHTSLDDILSTIVTTGVEVAVDADGTNANDFTVSTGTYYLHAHDQITVASIIYSAGVGHGDTDISRYYHSSGSWTSEAANGVDFGFWDDGTDKAAVTASKWYVAFIFAEGATEIDYVYPQTEHDTEAAALAEAITYPPFHQGFVVPLAAFVFRGSQTDFTVPSRTYFEDIRPVILGISSRAASQFVFATFTGDSGSVTADAILDSFSFTGGAGITTAVSGKVVTITATGGGSGDVVGPGSSTDNTLARYHLTTGKIIQETSIVVDDSDNISGLGTVSAGAAGFTVDADGDTVAKSVTITKVDGVAGEVQIYEANSTDTSVNGFRGAASLADNQIFQLPNADPTAGQIWTIGAPSSTISQITYASFDETTIENSAGTIQVKDAGVSAAKLGADAKFQSYAVAGLSDTTTPSVLTTAESTNKCISNYKGSGADHVFTMPAAHAAGNVIFPIGDEFQVDIEPDTGDLFYLNGTAMAANEHIQNTADTLGERIVGYCVNINGTLRWMFYSSDTAWVEETPP